MVTRRRPDTELKGLVYGLSELPSDEGVSWYRRPGVLAIIVGAVLIVLNLWFR
jgi:hypothetical protein